MLSRPRSTSEHTYPTFDSGLHLKVEKAYRNYYASTDLVSLSTLSYRAIMMGQEKSQISGEELYNVLGH